MAQARRRRSAWREDDRRAWLGGIIHRELAQAANQSDESETLRADSVRYYLCAPRGDEIDGRSRAHSADVADMVLAVLGMLVPMLTGDTIAVFKAKSAQDRELAEAESRAVNQIIIEDNRGSIEIQEALKDALLMRNGAMKVTRESSETVQLLNTGGLSELQARAAGNRLKQQGAHVEKGDGVLRVVTEEGRFLVESVPIENLSWSAGDGSEVQKKRFFAEAVDLTRSELRKRGVPDKLVDTLGTGSREASTGPRSGPLDDMEGQSEDQQVISCHDCYLMVDLDGDGISERWRVLVADEKTVLEEERVELVPYAVGTCIINPHRLEGESLFEHLRGIQDSKTTLTRELENNVMLNNNGRVIFDPSRASEEDIMNPVAGGGIRARDPSAVVAMAVPDQTGGILAALTYADKRRSERGGAALDMMQADRQIVGETATGIERQYSQREQMVMMYASNFAETLIRSLFMLVHQTARIYGREPISVEMRGEFVELDPAQWAPRTNLNVKVGMTPGARAHMQQALLAHVQLSAQAMAQGMQGVLASPQTLYATQKLNLQMAGVQDVDALLIDPSSEAAQQAAKANADAAAAAQQQQMAMLDRQLAIEEQRVMVEEMKSRGELSHKYFATEAQMAMKEAELVGGAQLDLEKQAREAASAARREAAAARAGANDRSAA